MAEKLKTALNLALAVMSQPDDPQQRLVFADALDEADYPKEAEHQRDKATSVLKRWKQLLGENWDESAMERRSKEVGSHWFSKDTRRFFKSRIGQIFQGPAGVFFVSSEAEGFDGRGRSYTVRQFDPLTGNVSTPGEFLRYRDRRAACREAERLARSKPSPETQALLDMLARMQ